MVKKLIFLLVVISLSTTSALAGGMGAENGVRGAVQKDLLPSQSWQDFEKQLKSSYVGTYAIYGTLPDSKRKMVYDQLKNGGSINEVREIIVNARLSRG